MDLSSSPTLPHDANKSARPAPPKLSPREREIVRLIALGRSTKEIAAEFGVAHKTVENQRGTLFRKCRFRSLADVVRYAIRHGLIEP